MSRQESDWAYLVDETGNGWLHLPDTAKGKHAPLQDMDAPARAVYAIPAYDLVSFPQWIKSKDPEIISQVVDVEVEKLGVKIEKGTGRLVDWQAVEENGAETLVHSVAIPWNLPDSSRIKTNWTGFIPQHALFKPPANAVALWKEGPRWVAGYGRNGGWVHVQNMGQDPTFSHVAKDTSLTAIEFAAKGYIQAPEQIVVWADWDSEIHQALQQEFNIPVAFEKKPVPDFDLAGDWKFEPHQISETKLKKKSRKQNATFLAVFISLLIFLLIAGFLHIKWVERENAALLTKIKENTPEMETIQAAVDKWEVMAPAVDPQRSPIEILHRISTLIPDKGFRIASFEIENSNKVIVRGEASAMSIGIQLKGAIEKEPSLANYIWTIKQPKKKVDLFTLEAIGSLPELPEQ